MKRNYLLLVVITKQPFLVSCGSSTDSQQYIFEGSRLHKIAGGQKTTYP
jgi:hypothetical protein